jgi:hypothetical protein
MEMTFGPRHYIPCLRWKQGEYQAIHNLSSTTRDSIAPIIEVSELGYDFETQTNSKTIDEHLSSFATRVKDNWGIKKCFVDMHYIEPSEHMSDGQNPGAFIFSDLRSKSVMAIPVIRMREDPQNLSAIRETVNIDKRGLCLRAKIDEIAREGFEIALEDLLWHYGVDINQCDLIIDLVSPNFDPIDRFAIVLMKIIQNMPHLNDWRSFGLIGTSFPQSLQGCPQGITIINRNEWCLYKLLVANLMKIGARLPCFGDYAIHHPKILKIDPKIMKPSAGIRYTIKDNWLIAKGRTLKIHGYGQFRELSLSIINSGNYSGKDFSEGDNYIFKCANGIAKTGSLSTWRRVGTNHHIEMVVRDVANFVAS